MTKYILAILFATIGINGLYAQDHSHVESNDSVEQIFIPFSGESPSDETIYRAGSYDPNEDVETPTVGGEIAVPIQGELLLLPLLALYVGYIMIRRKQSRSRKEA